jgi:hypothetical protein
MELYRLKSRRIFKIKDNARVLEIVLLAQMTSSTANQTFPSSI